MMSGEGGSHGRRSHGTGGEDGPELKKFRGDADDDIEVEEMVPKEVEVIDLSGDDEDKDSGGTSPTESQPGPSSAVILNGDGGNNVGFKIEPGQDKKNDHDGTGIEKEKMWEKIAELNGEVNDLRRMLQDKERENKFLNKELDVKNKELSELHYERAKEKQQVKFSEAEVKERNKEIRRLEGVSKEKTKKIRCLEGEMEEKAKRIQLLEEEKAKGIQHLEGEMEKNAKRIQHLEGEMEEKAKRIQHLEGEMEKNAKRIQHLEGEMEEKAKRIRRLEGETEEKAKRIRRLEGETEEKAKQIRCLEGETEEKAKQIQCLEGQVEEKTMENLDLVKKEEIQRLKADALVNLIEENLRAKDEIGELKTENEHLKQKLALTAAYMKKQIDEMAKATSFLTGEENGGNVSVADPEPPHSGISGSSSMLFLMEGPVSTSAETEPTSDNPPLPGPGLKREGMELMQITDGSSPGTLGALFGGPGPSLEQYVNINHLKSDEDPDLFLLHHEYTTKVRQQEYVCSCGKTYASNCGLRQHIQSSNERWKFKCNECEGGFFTYSQLRTHMDQKHGKSVPWRIGCVNCGKTFKNHKDFYEHKQQECTASTQN